MTKADKIKICREFMRGESVVGMAAKGGGRATYFDQLDIQQALRWGLKHPEELRKGEK